MIAAAGGAGEYSCHIVPWIQGEADANQGTAYETYSSKLLVLASDLESDIRAATDQDGPVYMLIVQVTKNATSNDGPARAMFDAMAGSNKIYTILPSYRLPYVNSIHYSAAGAKLAGAYIGRAYAQMVKGYQPDILRPVSATMRGKTIRLRFDVPHLPLRFDTVSLASATNNGFRVTDNGSTTAIGSMQIDGSDVLITLVNDPVGDIKIRYALDYTGAGRPSAEGSGNLRDNASEVITIGGTDYQLFNAAPAFEMVVVRLGE